MTQNCVSINSMNKHIASYLKAHELAWAPSTLKSERARLNSVADILTNGPEAVYKIKSAELKPYALKTLFIRLADFDEHQRLNIGFKAFMKENARLFKHAYVKEQTGHGSINQVSNLLADIQSDRIRALATGILRNGLRISELTTYSKSTGLVVGKGGRVRRLLAPEALPDQLCSEREVRELRRELKRLGLKPHTLRKAAASALARDGGLRSEDLLYVMGWNSLQTAASYLQPLDDARLTDIANKVLGG